MDLSNFLNHLDRPKKTAKGWAAKCPSHADRSPSLHISTGTDNRILLKCFAGCSVEEIVSSLGLTLRSLFADSAVDRDALIAAKRKRETKEQTGQILLRKAAVRFRAEKVLKAVTDVDLSQWSVTRLDEAMNDVSIAYEVLWMEELEGYRTDGVF